MSVAHLGFQFQLHINMAFEMGKKPGLMVQILEENQSLCFFFLSEKDFFEIFHYFSNRIFACQLFFQIP